MTNPKLLKRLFPIGVILIIQSFCLFVARGFSLYFEETLIIQRIAYFLLKIVGANVSFFDNKIILLHDQVQVSFLTTYDQIGVPFLLVLLGSFLIFNLFYYREFFKKNIIKFIWISGVYIIFRYVFLISLYPYFNSTKIFWDYNFLFFTFIILIIILSFSIEH